MYLNSGIDGEEALYVTSEDGFYRLKGYSVYYERNQMMQDYMILRKDVRRVETGANDRVIRDFRSRMEGRKQDAVSRRGTIRTLGTLCSVLSVAVLAGGVVMFNNYQKMKEMESVLVSVLPSGVRGLEGYQERDDGDELVVEQIKGNVYPTGNAAGETVGISDSGIPDGGRPVDKTAIPDEGGDQEGGYESAAADPSGAGAIGEETGMSDGAGSIGGETGTSDGAGSQETASAQPIAQAQESAPPQTEAAKEPNILPEPEAQDGQAPSGAPRDGGNATAGKDYPVTNMKPGKTYIIGEGETLYGICFKLYDNLNYLEDICALNHLDDVNKIIAGQELVLPDVPEGL